MNTASEEFLNLLFDYMFFYITSIRWFWSDDWTDVRFYKWIPYVPYYLKEIHASDSLRESVAVTPLHWGGGGNIFRRVVTNIKPSEIQKGGIKFDL
jgi:hypothetical protein